MPNWCQNTISVSGDAADISEFKNWIGEGEGLLTKIKPLPRGLADTISGFYGDPEKQKEFEAQEKSNLEQFGYKNWYDWNIGNWGTKWDVSVEIDDFNTTDTEILLSFDSAWSPPQRAIFALATKFNKLTIRHSYLEEGVGFVGYDLYENGQIALEEYSENPESDEWKQLATDEFGWEPWPDDDAEMEVVQVTETPKPAKKKVKKAKEKKKPAKKVSKKKGKKN